MPNKDELERKLRKKARRDALLKYDRQFTTKAIESKRRKQELNPKYEKQLLEDELYEDDNDDLYNFWEVSDE